MERPRFSFGEMALSEEPDRLVSEPLDVQNNVSEEIGSLRTKVSSEQHCPEILSFAAKLVGKVRDKVAYQTAEIEELEDDLNRSFEVHIKKVDVDRVQYMLRCYYRTRLQKIERNVQQILKEPSLYERLSEHEKAYAVGYMDLLEAHFRASFLKKLPPKLRDLTNDKDGRVESIPTVDINQFVLIRALSNITSYVVSEDPQEPPFNFYEDEVYCVRYAAIKDLLEKGSVELI